MRKIEYYEMKDLVVFLVLTKTSQTNFQIRLSKTVCAKIRCMMSLLVEQTSKITVKTFIP